MTIKNSQRRRAWVRSLAFAVVVLGAIVALGVLATACGMTSKYTEPYHDAPRGATNKDAADVIEMPDGFSNAATKCDHGNRVYVIYKNDNLYGSIAVVPGDPTCKGR